MPGKNRKNHKITPKISSKTDHKNSSLPLVQIITGCLNGLWQLFDPGGLQEMFLPRLGSYSDWALNWAQIA